MTSAVPLQQLTYDVAYFVLPKYVFHDLERLLPLWQGEKPLAGLFCLAMASKLRGLEPDANLAMRFHAHQGELDGSRKYLALEYPLPRGFNPENITAEDLLGANDTPVLPPYFSAIVLGQGETEYYILGQSPVSGLTTLRQLLPDGKNCNLGPGPAPQLDSFLDALRNLEQDR